MKAVMQISPSEMMFRAAAGLVGLVFFALGIGFLAFPDIFATAFAVQPMTIQGLNAIRGDFGGVFLGMSFFSFLAATTGRCRWLLVPIVFLTLVIVGRLLSLWLDGYSAVGVESLKIEAVLLIILGIVTIVHARRTDAGEKGIALGEILNFKTATMIAIAVIIFGGLILSQKKIGMALVKTIGSEIMSADVIGDLPDGLHVALIGTGAPLADPRKASFSVGVIAGKDLYVVDAGPSSVRKLELMNLPHGSIKAALITHFHSDHIGDLGELMLKRWTGGSMGSPLPVFGPEGVEQVVAGFNMAYSLDFESRILHHGPEVVPPSGAGGVAHTFHIPCGEESVVVIEEKGLRVTAFLVDHDPVDPAVGYRFDYRGRSVVISGDTVAVPSLYRQAREADLLLMDALQPAMVEVLAEVALKSGRINNSKILEDILDYHASPEDGAIIANWAGVGHLVFTHILPPLPVAELKPAFLGASRKFYGGPITIAEDGMLFSLPAGSNDITRRWLL